MFWFLACASDPPAPTESAVQDNSEDFILGDVQTCDNPTELHWTDQNPNWGLRGTEMLEPNHYDGASIVLSDFDEDSVSAASINPFLQKFGIGDKKIIANQLHL